MFNTSKILFIISAFFLFSCGSGEHNDQSSEADSVNEGDTEIEVGEDVAVDNEEDFLINANMNTQLQIALGKIAQEKSNSPEVKALAESVVNENQQIQNNIMELAKGAGIEMAAALSPEYVSLLDSIQVYSGDRFDSAFVNLVIEEHQEDIENFGKIAGKTNNPIVRDQITNNIELMQKHLEAAKEIEDVVEE